MGSLKVAEIDSREDRQEMVMFPWTVYRGDRNWVPPIIKERQALLDPGSNPFFEKAGMNRYEGTLPVRCVRIKEALSLVGIEDALLIDAELVQRKITKLSAGKGMFLQREINRFLQAYGKRKFMPPGLAPSGARATAAPAPTLRGAPPGTSITAVSSITTAWTSSPARTCWKLTAPSPTSALWLR